MAVTIGIPTYNRKELLQIMAASLYDSFLSQAHNIRVYDDKSTEYGVEELRNIFPEAVSIHINETNIKADKNMYKMYYDFIHNTNDEYFFNADSDIIFKKDWLEKSMELIKKTNGILSLFNALSHKSYEEFDDNFVLKKVAGAAGMLFSRERLEELLSRCDSIEMVRGFDWQWSEYFNSNSKPIFCVKESLIQHIGYTGQNSKYIFDFGSNYKIETIGDGQIINDILERYVYKIRELEIERNKIDREKERLENSLVHHIKRCLILAIKNLTPKRIRHPLKAFARRIKHYGIKESIKYYFDKYIKK